MTKKSRNVCVRIKVSVLRSTQNIQRALAENYFPFVFTSESTESRIDHEGFENQH